ncbi:MAG: zinc-binding dehydrogenase, partial [Ignavibacteria bacterium]|nr:zinc-binding dehydrogenase [Ignavibacteria bacterium]
VIQTAERIIGNLNEFKPLGYSSAGEVIKSTSEKFKPSDRVACAGAGYANHAEFIFIKENLAVKIPENVSFAEAAFTTVGAIALQGLRQADVKIGDTVAVIGLGLIGLITIQLLKANGCKVIGLDISDDALTFAKSFGSDYVFKSSKSSKDEIINVTNGYGVDSVLITAGSSSNEPIELAGEISRERAKVVIVGAVKADIPRGSYYRKELEVLMSRSYGPGRYDVSYEEEGNDYPIGYVRWTENRNMKAFLELVADKKIQVKSLITHQFEITDYEKAYDLILGKSNEFYRGILFKYNQKSLIETKLYKTSFESKQIEKISIGFIGPGSFAQTNLLPHLKHLSVTLHTVCDTDGLRARNAAEKFKFINYTSDYESIFNNDEINT